MPHRHNTLHLRSAIIQSIRAFFTAREFLEVETPLLIPANAVEEYIEPKAADGWYLQTSPEICMKRLLCRGHERIFQISRCWRSGERGKRHCPEFTMLEWYRSNSDYTDLMQDCEALLKWISCQLVDHALFADIHNILPSLTTPPLKISVTEAFQRYGAKEVSEAVADGTFDEFMVTKIEPALPPDIPVLLMDYPSEMAALARLKRDDPSVAERFELYLGGLELANGFSELTDPAEQRARFETANEKRKVAGTAPLPLPEPFLAELACMPAAAGIALGIDRLIMLITGSECIDDVIAFTPEEL